MINLQDGLVKQTKRGLYSPEAHEISNNLALNVANMMSASFGAKITKCVVNPSLIGKMDFYSGDDGGFDIEIECSNEKIFNLPISNKKKNICIEVEAKLLKTKFFDIKKIWPSHFKTVDFGWLKYRDSNNQNKSYIIDKIKEKESDLWHFICLHYIDENNKKIQGYNYSWAINLKNLIKKPVNKKDTSRMKNEKFYTVSINDPDMILFNLNNGDIQNIKY
jgi:hypothetical protein